MPTVAELRIQNISAAQAAALSLLVELEARWENLRSGQPPVSVPTMRTNFLGQLLQKQKAYDAFLQQLLAYNKRYAPAHVPEMLLNTPTRLGAWCARMRELQIRMQNDSAGRSSAQLVEKAYRLANRLADRMSKSRIDRPLPSADSTAMIREWENLDQWCGVLRNLEGAAVSITS